MTPTLIIDTREPDPHPWAAFWDLPVIRDTLSTGDICLAGNPDVVVERKTALDLVACISAQRGRFERELRRASHLASFAVVVNASFSELLLERGGLHPNAIVGTLAAWQRRYRMPFVFIGNDSLAADFTLRFLRHPLQEAERLLKLTAGNA